MVCPNGGFKKTAAGRIVGINAMEKANALVQAVGGPVY